MSLLGSRAGSAAEMPVQSIPNSLCPAPPAAQRRQGRAWQLSMHLSLHGSFPHSLGSTHWQRLILPRAGAGSAGRAKGLCCSSFPPAPLPGLHSEHYNGVLSRRDCVLLFAWGGQGVIFLMLYSGSQQSGTNCFRKRPTCLSLLPK